LAGTAAPSGEMLEAGATDADEGTVGWAHAPLPANKRHPTAAPIRRSLRFLLKMP
jgi:hypothetical protein